jgi:hypothetical protein
MSSIWNSHHELPALNSTVTCPVMGTLLNTGSPNTIFAFDQMAGTYKRVAGPPALGRKEVMLGVIGFDVQYYLYPLAPWCTNGMPDPALTVAEDTSDHSWWKTFSVYVGSSVVNQWTLIWSKSIGDVGQAPAPCDLTPQPFYSFL